MGTGLTPQKTDNRDKKYRTIGKTKNNTNIATKTGTVRNQGRSNACTAFAVCEMMDYFLEHKKNISWKGFKSSPLYLWYFCRLKEGNNRKNYGAVLRNVFKTIKNYGFVLEKQHPFSNNWYKRPEPKIVQAGYFFKLYLKQLPKYYSIRTRNRYFSKHVSNCLTNEHPIVFGFPIYDELAFAKSTSYKINTSTGKYRGYHAMLIVGENKNYYIIKNSWGTRWGRKGYCWIKKDLIQKQGIDFWTLK